MLSKCPNCKSTFEIDEVQLTAANGLVRCGACLHVFNGREHLTAEPEQAQAVKEFSGIDEELEAIEAQIQALTKQRTVSKPSKSLDADIEDFAKIFQDDTTSPIKGMADDIDTFDITKGKPEHFESSQDFHVDSWAEEETRVESSLNTSTSNQLNTEIKEEETDHDDLMVGSTSSMSATAQKTAAQKKRSKLEDDINEFFADSDRIQHNGSGTGSLRPTEEAGFSGQQKKQSLDSLRIDDPLHFDDDEEKQPGKNWALPGVLMVLFIILVGSIGYVVTQFEALSQDPKWRPRLATICGIAPCELPPTHSVKYLKVTSLTTTAKDDQVEVNAVIFNTNQNFDMPFPTLIMKFTDLNDKLVAEFEIFPDEYRQGELARIDEFPSKTSAHITFTLPSPGKDGVNYTMSFAYPE